jgi:hypothetical protein
MGRLIASLLPLLLVAGCSLDLGEAPFYCCKECKPQCPDGYECKGNSCVKEGTCPDTVPGCKSGGDCGNGSCDAPESCESCPQDCGKCPICGDGTCEKGEDPTSCPQDCAAGKCGNGTCEEGETPTSCPKDCGTDKCGNGKCEAGEDETSCPADCGGSCTQDQTKCVDKTTIKFCDAGQWKSEPCDNLCKNGGYDYSAGCEFSPQDGKEVCLCGKYSKFGEMCTDNEVQCEPSLFCGFFVQGDPGFCTKYCSNPGGSCSGAPFPAQAECLLEVNNQTACGFTCDFATCPTNMKCDTSTSPALCKP